MDINLNVRVDDSQLKIISSQLANIDRKVSTIMATTAEALETLATTVSDAIVALNAAKASAVAAEERAQAILDNDAVTDAAQIADAQATLDAEHAAKIGEVQTRLADALKAPEVPVEPPVTEEPGTEPAPEPEVGEQLPLTPEQEQ